jgi:hypothetical protein
MTFSDEKKRKIHFSTVHHPEVISNS